MDPIHQYSVAGLSIPPCCTRKNRCELVYSWLPMHTGIKVVTGPFPWLWPWICRPEPRLQNARPKCVIGRCIGASFPRAIRTKQCGQRQTRSRAPAPLFSAHQAYQLLACTPDHPAIMESDERESSPHAPHDLLTELPSPTSTNPPNPSASSSTVRLTSPPIPAWFASASSRSSPSHGLRPPGLIPRRSASAREHHPSSLPDAHYSSAGALASTSRTTSPSSASHIPLPPNSSSLFATPSRSIFASGPPTASVSSNTAHASMSSPPPSATHLPLSALSSGVSSSAGPALRSSSGVGRGGPNHGSQAEDSPPPARRPRFALVEKTSDDPSAAVEDGPPSRSEDRTRTALSNLFAAPETGPSISRHNSYVRTPSGTQYTRGTSHSRFKFSGDLLTQRQPLLLRPHHYQATCTTEDYSVGDTQTLR